MGAYPYLCTRRTAAPKPRALHIAGSHSRRAGRPRRRAANALCVCARRHGHRRAPAAANPHAVADGSAVRARGSRLRGRGKRGNEYTQQTYFRRGGVSRPDVCSKAQPCSRQTAKTYNLTPEKARITPESAGTPRRASTRKPLRAQRSGCTVQRSGATCCAYVCQPRPPLAHPPRQYGLIQAYQGPRSLEAQISAASGPSPHSAMFARQCS